MSTATIDIAPPPAGTDLELHRPVVHRDRRGLGALVAASAVGGLLASGITWAVVTAVSLDLPMNALGF
jgi:hypothetical protein